MNRELRTLFGALVQHLHDETDALVRGDAERVAELAARKSDILHRIAPLARRAPADLPRDLVAEAHQLNDRNALLLAPRLVAARSRLDMLSQAMRQAGNPMVYGADGRAQAFGRTAARA